MIAAREAPVLSDIEFVSLARSHYPAQDPVILALFRVGHGISIESLHQGRKTWASLHAGTALMLLAIMSNSLRTCSGRR